jgi:hypothetical protein
LNVLVPAAVTGIGLLGLAAWNGTWLRADALSQLGGFLTRGGSAFSGALPAAVVGLVLVVTAALDAAARPAPRP